MKFFVVLHLIVLFFFCSCGSDNDDLPSEGIPDPRLSFLESKMKDSIKIIAHGGASAYKPFNSISAFKKAFELSADGIELDLMNSKDDSLMVFHDLNTEKITGADYNMIDTNASILRTLNIGKGEKMPFLDEVFDIVPKGKTMFLEIKWYQDLSSRNNLKLIDELILKIQKSGRINDCTILCFDLDYLSKIKKKKPELRCFWITNDSKTVDKISEELLLNNFEGTNVNMALINYKLAKSLKVKNQMLFAWTVDDGKSALELYDNYKINGIYTNKPDVIRLSLAKFF